MSSCTVLDSNAMALKDSGCLTLDRLSPYAVIFIQFHCQLSHQKIMLAHRGNRSNGQQTLQLALCQGQDQKTIQAGQFVIILVSPFQLLGTLTAAE